MAASLALPDVTIFKLHTHWWNEAWTDGNCVCVCVCVCMCVCEGVCVVRGGKVLVKDLLSWQMDHCQYCGKMMIQHSEKCVSV